MINLLPPQAKKNLTKEYWLRIFSVWALLVSGLCLILSALLLPTYILIHSQFNLLAVEDQKNNEIEGKFRMAEASVIEANKLAEVLSQSLTNSDFTSIIEAIHSVRTQDIQLTMINLAQGDAHTVQVQGEAASRASLIQFKSALESSPLFESALIPLSDFARDTKLPFSVTITLSKVKN